MYIRSMYKRIILLIIVAILLIASAIFILREVFINNTLTVSPQVLQKFNENYPAKNLFPYRSANLTADYSLEPKKINILLKSNTTKDSALSEIDSYLKSRNESISNLQSKGVMFLFNEDNFGNTLPITE